MNLVHDYMAIVILNNIVNGMTKEQWSTNLEVRTEISTFLAGAFFTVLLIFVTQQNTTTIVDKMDIHYVFTIISLTITFVSYAFSTFAFGLSADAFRKGSEGVEATTVWDQRAKTAFYVGGSFFKLGYFMTMISLVFILAYVNLIFGLIGLLIFAFAWFILSIKTGFPYKRAG